MYSFKNVYGSVVENLVKNLIPITLLFQITFTQKGKKKKRGEFRAKIWLLKQNYFLSSQKGSWEVQSFLQISKQLPDTTTEPT